MIPYDIAPPPPMKKQKNQLVLSLLKDGQSHINEYLSNGWKIIDTKNHVKETHLDIIFILEKTVTP